jgi:hypothetical protein
MATPPIEPEFELAQTALEMLPRDRILMGAQHPALPLLEDSALSEADTQYDLFKPWAT